MGTLYLIRHGQAGFAKTDYDQLAPAGFEQARVLGAELARRIKQVDAVYSGTLVRHRDTARTCLEAMGIEQPVRELPGLNEYDHVEIVVRANPAYADQQAMYREMATHADPRRAFQAFFQEATLRWVGGQHDAEYAESWPAFKTRTTGALDEIVAAQPGSQTVLVFTSGGVISALAQKLLGVGEAQAAALNWRMVNCSVSKLIYSPRGVTLSSLNEHGHFEGARADLITYR